MYLGSTYQVDSKHLNQTVPMPEFCSAIISVFVAQATKGVINFCFVRGQQEFVQKIKWVQYQTLASHTCDSISSLLAWCSVILEKSSTSEKKKKKKADSAQSEKRQSGTTSVKAHMLLTLDGTQQLGR